MSETFTDERNTMWGRKLMQAIGLVNAENNDQPGVEFGIATSARMASDLAEYKLSGVTVSAATARRVAWNQSERGSGLDSELFAIAAGDPWNRAEALEEVLDLRGMVNAHSADDLELDALRAWIVEQA